MRKSIKEVLMERDGMTLEEAEDLIADANDDLDIRLEEGHGFALDYLGKQPLLDLNMRLGEGTGAALAMTLVEAAFRILTEVATFEEASVSEADK